MQGKIHWYSITMTSDDSLASTVAVSIASITKPPVLSPLTDQTVSL